MIPEQVIADPHDERRQRRGAIVIAAANVMSHSGAVALRRPHVGSLWQTCGADVQLFERDYQQPKTFRDGTHRARSPAETLAAYLPLAPQLGITRLARITGLDRIGIPVYVAIRPCSRSLATSQGKGLDDASAKASALMESIEAWHAERTDLPARYDTARSLARSGTVIDLEGLLVNKGATVRDDMPLWWVQGWDLLGGRPMWVPYEAVTLNFVRPPRDRPTFCTSSNGLASGNHPLEAIAHGLCEVIERDADAAWHRYPDRIPESAVDPATVDDPLCRILIERLAAARMSVMMFDVSGDVGVPTYRSMITDQDGVVGPCIGTGSHLAPGVALLRALTEAVQSRGTYIAGSRDDLFYRDYERLGSSLFKRRMAEFEAHIEPRRSFRDAPSVTSDTFEGDLAILVERVRAVGATSAVAVDLSRSELGIPVWKVLVPGFQLDDIPTAEVRSWRHAQP